MEMGRMEKEVKEGRRLDINGRGGGGGEKEKNEIVV